LGVYGYKSFHGSLAEGVRYIVVLCRQSDGEILATVDAAHLTALRTAATSGVATDYMAPPGSATVGLIGSGLEAETNLAAVAAVRPVERVVVYSRSPERRTAFAARVGVSLGVDIQPVATPVEAVRAASIVIVATNSGHGGDVAYRGEWMHPGQHVVSIGATSPFLREVDPRTFERATTVVFDAAAEQVFEESGDLMVIEGELRERLLRAATLPQLVAGGPLARSVDDITLFKSVGTAAQDIAAAMSVYETALGRGLGRDIGELAKTKLF